MPSLPYENEDDVWIGVTIERDLDLKLMNRTIYTGFDFLSDIGGLQGMIYSFLGVFVLIWNTN